jgi:hypothetical protein
VRIDIKGRLAALCDNPALFPNMAMGSLGSRGALPTFFPDHFLLIYGVSGLASPCPCSY